MIRFFQLTVCLQREKSSINSTLSKGVKKMKKKSVLVLFSVAALTACSTNDIPSGNEANGEEK